MPPVLGPVSPSPTGLWSWQGSSSQMDRPATSASTLTSWPWSRSSMRMVEPASPNSRRTIMRSTASSASSGVSQTTTPLPAASPVALTTQGSSWAWM